MKDVFQKAKAVGQYKGQEKPSREEAEAAVRTLLLWIGENPNREGLKQTPARVVRAYEELFEGYKLQPQQILNTVFSEVSGYNDEIFITKIPFYSHCEHHMVPIIGRACVAYLPDKKVVGLSKIPRIIDVFAKRLQTQEALTAQIADALASVLQPRGVAVFVAAEHMCMAMRGIKKHDSTTFTQSFRGLYKEDRALQERFISTVRQSEKYF